MPNAPGDGPAPSPTALVPPSRLPPRHTLPDPLETLDGEPVETADDWRDRRAEIERLFRHYVYGYAPDPPELVTTVERTDGVLEGAATLVETTIGFAALPDDAPEITMATFLPADATDHAVPTVLAPNAFGNHGTVADPAVTITDAGAEYGVDERGKLREYWCVDRILARGYGFATYHVADLDPDADDFTDGIHSYYDDDLPGPAGTEWGTIAAWAWGLQRCVDVLRGTGDADGVDATNGTGAPEGNHGVDGDRIAVQGHSRRGKAALLAGATDERIALVAPHQSGTGGVALSRGNDQETVADITAGFPHWFADTFSAFAGRVEKLPVDQHLLVALVAPRPIIATDGDQDDWTNPDRALDALRAAAPVWDLLGTEGMVDDGLLGEASGPVGGLVGDDDEITHETAGDLCQYRRDTEHTLNRGYWDAVLDFADLHL